MAALGFITLSLEANGNLTVPLLLRQGVSALGPPPTCPPLPAAKPTGCLLAAPEYPLSNQTATGSINIFDPNLQVPYSDTYTVGIQRAIDRLSAIEVRYVGTRSRQQWQTFNYNEPNIHENGFLNSAFYVDANDLENEYGWSNIDQRHQFTTNGVVFLPKGFQVATQMRFNTGRPFSPRTGVDSNRDGIGARIALEIEEDGARRWIYKHVNTGGSFGPSAGRRRR